MQTVRLFLPPDAATRSAPGTQQAPAAVTTSTPAVMRDGLTVAVTQAPVIGLSAPADPAASSRSDGAASALAPGATAAIAQAATSTAATSTAASTAPASAPFGAVLAQVLAPTSPAEAGGRVAAGTGASRPTGTPAALHWHAAHEAMLRRMAGTDDAASSPQPPAPASVGSADALLPGTVQIPAETGGTRLPTMMADPPAKASPATGAAQPAAPAVPDRLTAQAATEPAAAVTQAVAPAVRSVLGENAPPVDGAGRPTLARAAITGDGVDSAATDSPAKDSVALYFAGTAGPDAVAAIPTAGTAQPADPTATGVTVIPVATDPPSGPVQTAAPGMRSAPGENARDSENAGRRSSMRAAAPHDGTAPDTAIPSRPDAVAAILAVPATSSPIATATEPVASRADGRPPAAISRPALTAPERPDPARHSAGPLAPPAGASAGRTDAAGGTDPATPAVAPVGANVSSSPLHPAASIGDVASSAPQAAASATAAPANDALALVQSAVPPAGPATAAPIAGPAPLPTPVQPAPPTAQVAQAVVHLTGASTGTQITVALNPDSLGRVQVQIDRGADGAAHVILTAERPETLALLQGDQRQLDAALTRSGLAEFGRTISFHSQAAGAEPPPQQQGLAGSGSGWSGGSTASMPDRQGARGGGESFVWSAPQADGEAEPAPAKASPLRLRLDITA